MLHAKFSVFSHFDIIQSVLFYVICHIEYGFDTGSLPIPQTHFLIVPVVIRQKKIPNIYLSALRKY